MTVSPDSPENRPVDLGFLLLASVFLASLVVCNLIARKFVTVDLGFKEFTLSAGVLPYPITFLVTDLLSEIYGRRRARLVVWAGFAASLFTLIALWLGAQFDAIPNSKVSNATYEAAFSDTWRVIGASMVAYLAAQFVDVRMFHFWRGLTNGRHLWLRNNASTVVSQLLDTALVVTGVFAVELYEGEISGAEVASMILDGWLFKALVALADTPLFYYGTWVMQRWRPATL